MKSLKSLLVLVLAIAGAFAAESALAWNHSRVVVGVGIGVPVGGPYYGGYYGYGGYPYYYPPYYPAPVVVQQQPTVYVEQQPAASNSQAGYWYYCGDSRAYYPYVKECASGWQRVAPQPQQ